MMMIGELAILTVGDGDTKLTFDPDKPDEAKRAAAIVKDMIRRGFAILIQVGEQDGEPIYRRAHDFDENSHEYIIAGAPENLEIDDVKEPPSQPQKSRPAKAPARPRQSETRIPASRAKATAIARTAGG